MKIFVRSIDGEPQVVASYPDDADVPADAHGKDAQVFVVPKSFVRPTMPTRDPMDMPTIKLSDNWRASAKPPKLSLERVVEALDQRVATLEAAIGKKK